MLHISSLFRVSNLFLSWALIAGLCLMLAGQTAAQTATFTFQGRLTDNSASANGMYQMQFSLYDSSGTQLGSTITNNSVTVTNGVFTVQLNFSPATPFATGADRWIEIAVRKAADPPGFTILTPRQQITSSPYSTKSLGAASADSLSATCVLCITDAHITSIDSFKITGVLSASRGGTGLGIPPIGAYLKGTVGGWGFAGLSGDGSGLTNLNGANITANSVSSAALAGDTFPNSQNLSRLGQLRWDLLGQRVAVGGGPQSIAFDGANIWVANRLSSNVTKLRASDGTVQATFAVGTFPTGVAFDGANIWVANEISNNVTKLRASDGALQGTFAAGTNPQGVAFDGANIWVTNFGSNNVTKLRASDGAPQGTFAVGTGPIGVAFDTVNIWVTNSGSNNVTKLRSSDGAPQGTFAVGTQPAGIAYDGSNMWVTSVGSTMVAKLRASDGSPQGTFAVGSQCFGVVFDGANVWVTSYNNSTVTKLRATDGALQGTFTVGNQPYGVAFDGANIWVAVPNTNNVAKLPVFP